jgi:glycosyltransferase involved in cell wall biosynthesis
MFANSYISKNQIIPFIQSSPDPRVEIIIVIPCLNEPDIIQTLESLLKSIPPDSPVEVIVIINHSITENSDIKESNLKTRKKIDQWVSSNSACFLHVFPVGPLDLPEKWAGAGLARKKGMDEAIIRFNKIGKPHGIIVSLDSDTVVAENYLIEIQRHFADNPDHIAATIMFEHRKQNLSDKLKEGIILYENYLHYYKNALKFTGFPYAMYTVGSAFAVTADAYVRRGGMTRRKGAEEFYFLQKLAHQGKIGEIAATKVFPSSRTSERAPFGTGQMMKKWMEGKEDLSLVVSFQAFVDLKLFFLKKDSLFKINKQDFDAFLDLLPVPVSDFLKADDFWTIIEELNKNCSDIHSFQTRFFHLFDAFKVHKYMNYVHLHHFRKANIDDQIELLNQKTDSLF